MIRREIKYTQVTNPFIENIILKICNKASRVCFGKFPVLLLTDEYNFTDFYNEKNNQNVKSY